MKVTTFFKRALAVVLMALITAGPLAGEYFYRCGPAWITETNGAAVSSSVLLLMLLLGGVSGALVYSSIDD